MNFSILLPHYKTWKMSFYAIRQLLKHRGRHQIDICVVDNHPQDETGKLLKSFYGDQIRLYPYPSQRMQSHGIAYDYVIPELRTEALITVESDSFPTQDDWLDWYEILMKDGYASAGSALRLSGGHFVHTAGAFYKKSIWQKAKRYIENVEYAYFPNIAMKDKFPCHLMVHESVMDQFMRSPGNLVSLSPEYSGKDEDYFAEMLAAYMPIGRGVFHNGIGNTDESYYTYAKRNADIEGERNNILLDNSKPFIWRMGMEPGQWFCYWMLANDMNIYNIPTETVWMPGREDQQQAYTKMANGFTHLWAVTAYDGSTDPSIKDIADFKKQQVEELYESIPAKQRI